VGFISESNTGYPNKSFVLGIKVANTDGKAKKNILKKKRF
jgi:hypothetical protein